VVQKSHLRRQGGCPLRGTPTIDVKHQFSEAVSDLRSTGFHISRLLVRIKFKLMAARVKPLLRFGLRGLRPSSACNLHNNIVYSQKGAHQLNTYGC